MALGREKTSYGAEKSMKDQVWAVNCEQTFKVLIEEALRIQSRCGYSGDGEQVLNQIKDDNRLFAYVYQAFVDGLKG